MKRKFEESRPPVFQGTNALNRGVMRKKKDKDTIHYNGESSNVELLFRIIHSANQFCVHGTAQIGVEPWEERNQRKEKILGMN